MYSIPLVEIYSSLFSGSISFMYAQTNILPCGTSQMTKKEFEKNPEIFLKKKHILDSLSKSYQDIHLCH